MTHVLDGSLCHLHEATDDERQRKNTLNRCGMRRTPCIARSEKALFGDSAIDAS